MHFGTPEVDALAGLEFVSRSVDNYGDGATEDEDEFLTGVRSELARLVNFDDGRKESALVEPASEQKERVLGSVHHEAAAFFFAERPVQTSEGAGTEIGQLIPSVIARPVDRDPAGFTALGKTFDVKAKGLTHLDEGDRAEILPRFQTHNGALSNLSRLSEIPNRDALSDSFTTDARADNGSRKGGTKLAYGPFTIQSRSRFHFPEDTGTKTRTI